MDETPQPTFSLETYLSADWVTGLIYDVLSAIVVLLLTLWAARWLAKRAVNLQHRFEDLDETPFLFLGKVVRILVLILGFTIILGKFGVQTASIVAVVGSAGLAVGLALQGTLSNFAAGVMLIIFRPFKKGDFIIVSGMSGTVKDILIFTTELATPDNVQIIVPNALVWGQPITNYSSYDTRRLDLVFSVSPDSDLKTAETILTNLVAGDDRISDQPEPLVRVGGLGYGKVDFNVRVWCAASDYWDINYDLTRSAKIAFDKAGVALPAPAHGVA